MATPIDSEWEDVVPQGNSEWEDVAPESVEKAPSWAGVPGRFIKGAADTVKGIAKLGMMNPKELGTMFKDPETNPIWQMLPHPTVDDRSGKVGVDAGAIANQAVDIATEPVQTFKRDPFGTTAFFAPLFPKVAKVPAVSKAIQGVGDMAGSGVRKAISYLGDVPEDSVAFRMKNPAAVRSAKPISEIAATEVPRIANRFDEVIGGLNSEAKRILPTSSEGAFLKDDILGAVKRARRNLGGVYTPEAQTASSTLERLSGNLKKIRQQVSQNQVHDLITDLDREIPWQKVWKSPQDLTLQDKVLIEMRSDLSNMLKERNPKYSEIMGPLSDAIGTRNEFLKNLGVERVKGMGYQPSNTTTSRLAGATNEDRLATQRILGRTKDVTGESLSDSVRASQVKADFSPETGKSFKGGDSGLRQTFGRPVARWITDAIGGLKPRPTGTLKSAPVAEPLFREKERPKPKRIFKRAA